MYRGRSGGERQEDRNDQSHLKLTHFTEQLVFKMDLDNTPEIFRLLVPEGPWLSLVKRRFELLVPFLVTSFLLDQRGFT